MLAHAKRMIFINIVPFNYSERKCTFAIEMLLTSSAPARNDARTKIGLNG